MEEDEEFRTCLSATCKWGCFFSTKADGNIFVCQMCSFRHCVVCEAPMHEDETCDQYRARNKQRNKENRLSRKLVKTISKRCPGCKISIDKYDGCDHVTCMYSSSHALENTLTINRQSLQV